MTQKELYPFQPLSNYTPRRGPIPFVERQFRGPKDHINLRISHSSSKSQCNRDSRNRGLQDPYAYVQSYLLSPSRVVACRTHLGAPVCGAPHDADLCWGHGGMEGAGGRGGETTLYSIYRWIDAHVYTDICIYIYTVTNTSRQTQIQVYT